MKKIITKLFKNNFQIFLTVLFLIGLIGGIIYFFQLSVITKNEVWGSINHIKDTSPYFSIISNQLLLIIIIIILSFSIIGFPVIVFIFFYQAICLSFTTTAFIYFFGFRGLIFFGIYFMIVNLIFYLGLFYLTNLAYKMTVTLLNSLKKRVELNIGDFFSHHLKKHGLILSILLLYNGLMYFFGYQILKIFIFLL